MFATFDFDSFLCLKKTYKPQIRLFPPKYNAKKLQCRDCIPEHLFDYIYNVESVNDQAYWIVKVSDNSGDNFLGYLDDY